MKAILRTYYSESFYSDKIVEVRDERAFSDPYGEAVPFSVGSNQRILPRDKVPLKPTLETAGPLQVPVDETGTAIGRPEPAPDDVRSVLHRLYLEAQHYVDTGRGEQYLRNALWDARRVLEGGAL